MTDVLDTAFEQAQQHLLTMSVEWGKWCTWQKLPVTDAESMILYPNLTNYQRAYITSFMLRWDDCMAGGYNA